MERRPSVYQRIGETDLKEATVIVPGKDLTTLLERGTLIIEPQPDRVGSCDISLRISSQHLVLRNTDHCFALPREERKWVVLDRADPRFFQKREDESFVIHPNQRLLVRSLEKLKIPDCLSAMVGLRSTYSRLGFTTPPTFVDPGFAGHLVFELIGGAFPVRLYTGDPLFKLLFFEVGSKAEPYCGLYQGQDRILVPSSADSE